MSIFVYYDVMVIIAFLSFIVIKDFLLSCVFVCIVLVCIKSKWTCQLLNSRLKIKQREREINKAQFILMSQ